MPLGAIASYISFNEDINEIPQLQRYSTNSMQQSPSWEAESHTAIREILRPLWNPKVHTVFKPATGPYSEPDKHNPILFS
jgi:hypothetical protein